VYDWRHYLAVIQRKPGALRNGAPFLELPEAFKRLQHHLLRCVGGDREMVEILALVLHHDEQAVLVAVELALEDGVPSKTHILNRLHRLIDGKPATPPVVTAADSSEGGHLFQPDRGHHSNLMAASLLSSRGPVSVMS
jgi:hypothetical protein